MIKLLFLLVLASAACRLLAGQWPWQLLQGRRSIGSADTATARALLGVDRNASREDIIEAHRRLIGLVHPDRGGTSDSVHEANAARDLLLGRLRP